MRWLGRLSEASLLLSQLLGTRYATLFSSTLLSRLRVRARTFAKVSLGQPWTHRLREGSDCFWHTPLLSSESGQMERPKQKPRNKLSIRVAGEMRSRLIWWENAGGRRITPGRGGDVSRATLVRNRGRRRRALFGSAVAAVVILYPGEWMSPLLFRCSHSICAMCTINTNAGSCVSPIGVYS